MSSFCFVGQIRLNPAKEDIEKYKQENGFSLEVPAIYYEEEGEDYITQYDFSWSSKSIVIKEKDFVTKYSQNEYTELLAEDADGNIIWIDGRSAPYDGCWDGHYLKERRSAEGYTTVVYDLANKTKQVIEYSVKQTQSIPMTEYEINKYANGSNDCDEDTDFDDNPF